MHVSPSIRSIKYVPSVTQEMHGDYPRHRTLHCCTRLVNTFSYFMTYNAQSRILMSSLDTLRQIVPSISSKMVGQELDNPRSPLLHLVEYVLLVA